MLGMDEVAGYAGGGRNLLRGVQILSGESTYVFLILLRIYGKHSLAAERMKRSCYRYDRDLGAESFRQFDTCPKGHL